MNIDVFRLSDIINNGQPEIVISALEESKKYFQTHILTMTIADILDEAYELCNTRFPVDMLSDALEELEMCYILSDSDVRSLIAPSCFLSKDEFGSTITEYYLLGLTVIPLMFYNNLNYYLLIIENNRIRRIEITNKFSTSDLVKDNSYIPTSVGNILDGLASGNRGDDIG